MNSINSLQLSKDKNPEKVISEEGSQEEQEVIVPLIKNHMVLENQKFYILNIKQFH